ncbi:MAG TPA: hypothetical protein VK742_16065 [Candidatus Sulfotelmatobacter sp.]|nr:hypothetical protein [Candidatus Sulfotelmatobacter sp.]
MQLPPRPPAFNAVQNGIYTTQSILIVDNVFVAGYGGSVPHAGRDRTHSGFSEFALAI